MGAEVRIVAFRRHLPRLNAVDVANLKRCLDATPAGPFCTGMVLDERTWTWPDRYVLSADNPKPHVQAVAVDSGCRYFGVGYHRGDWPAFKAIILWLREHVSPDVWYGIDEAECCIRPADDELIEEHDAAWEASGEVSWYGRDEENEAA